MTNNKNCNTAAFLFPCTISLFFLLILFSSCIPLKISKKNKYKALTEKQKQEKRDSIINNSDYIFYGRTDGIIREFTDESKNDVYRVIRIYVHDVIRGPQELKNTYIFRITKVYGHQYYSDYGFQRIHNYLRPMYYTFVQNGYFFCNKNTKSLQYLTDSSYIHPDYLNFELFDKTYGFDSQSSFICEATSNIVHGISIDDWNNKTYKGLYGLHFANGQEVINYLLPYGNITHPIDTTASENK